MNISLYSDESREEWDNFISIAKNSYFMFYREYMEYHSHRFTDFSIMIRGEKNDLLAVLPANIFNKTLYSHQGLTFGGLCVKKDATTTLVLSMFRSLITFLEDTPGIEKFIYKRLPDHFTSYPSQEDLYSLFILNANLIRRDLTAAIDLHSPLAIANMRKRRVNKAIKNNVVVSETDDLKDYWDLLTQVLQSKYKTNPTHSYDEIVMLRRKFPKNIKCFVAKKDENIIAGTLIFETMDVVRTQYLANGPVGREFGGLDLVINELIEMYATKKRYFDFGISTEDSGWWLNTGLISQKEGFGGRALVQDHFCLNIK